MPGWSDSLPRVILVSLQHPTPYYDDSYLANSATTAVGRCSDQEMLPYLEANSGSSRSPMPASCSGLYGRWISAACKFTAEGLRRRLGILSDPRLSRVRNVDLTRTLRPFSVPGYEWTAPERFISRSVKGQPRVSLRDFSRLSAVLGSHGDRRILGYVERVYGPCWQRCYPQLVWTMQRQDRPRCRRVLAQPRFDLREYAERNWSSIGPSLAVSCILHGDMDNFYLNLAM